MAQPGMPSARGEDWLVRELQNLQREVRELKAANPFGAMGIAPKPDGTNFEGYVNINGPLEVNGESEFNGSLSINGPLILQPGSIENDALASPVALGRASNGETGFALTTSPQTFATTSITVPEGYTQALVFLVCTVGAINPNAASDFLYSSALIQGVPSRQVFGFVSANNGSVAVSTAKSDLLGGLAGGASISLAVNVHAQSAVWAASGANRAYVEAQAIFLR